MRITLFWKPLLWFGFVCYLLFVPSDQVPTTSWINIPHFDKLVHLMLFFIQAILLYKPLQSITTNHVFKTIALTMLLAVLLEFVQHKVSPTRSSNILDLLANLTGIVLSVLAYRYYLKGGRWEKYI